MVTERKHEPSHAARRDMCEAIGEATTAIAVVVVFVLAGSKCLYNNKMLSVSQNDRGLRNRHIQKVKPKRVFRIAWRRHVLRSSVLSGEIEQVSIVQILLVKLSTVLQCSHRHANGNQCTGCSSYAVTMHQSFRRCPIPQSLWSIFQRAL